MKKYVVEIDGITVDLEECWRYAQAFEMHFLDVVNMFVHGVNYEQVRSKNFRQRSKNWPHEAFSFFIDKESKRLELESIKQLTDQYYKISETLGSWGINSDKNINAVKKYLNEFSVKISTTTTTLYSLPKISIDV